MKLDVMQMIAVTHAGTPLIATHEVCLVVLSVAIAIITSYTALDLAGTRISHKMIKITCLGLAPRSFLLL